MTAGWDGGTTTALLTSETAAVEWPIWTTTARLVVTEPGVLPEARELVADLLERVGRAASRFRPDSEVSQLARGRAEGAVPISPLLADLVRSALTAAELTDGDIDPTVGATLASLGYDRDLADVSEASVSGARSVVATSRPISWRDVHLDGELLSMPPGVLLDLGATAKARAADSCAEMLAGRFGCGVLVSLGGDLRVAGPVPRGGWQVLVRDGDDEPASALQLNGPGAVATSSTLHRTWEVSGEELHHIVDPRTGRPARLVWRTVSVAATTCVGANTLTTAAVIRGEDALPLLEAAAVPARLVGVDGAVHTLGGWPA